MRVINGLALCVRKRSNTIEYDVLDFDLGRFLDFNRRGAASGGLVNCGWKGLDDGLLITVVLVVLLDFLGVAEQFALVEGMANLGCDLLKKFLGAITFVPDDFKLGQDRLSLDDVGQ